MMRLRSISMPGTLRGAEPVATMMSAGVERLLVARRTTSTFRLPASRAVPLIQVDLVLLEQKLDALGQAADDFVFARVHLRHVDRGRAGRDRHSPLFGVLDDLQRVRVLEQRLGRNASPDQAGAAERLLLLDDSDFLSKLRGADRGDIAASTCANHDDVVRIRQGVLLNILGSGRITRVVMTPDPIISASAW